MLTEWHARRLTKPSLLLHPLAMHFDELAAQLQPRKPRQATSDWRGCTDYVFEDADYKLIATVEDGSVVGYVHDTGIYRAKRAQLLRKLNDFLEFYGAGDELEVVVDNGFGLLFRSKSGKLRAAYSYVADIFSIELFRLERVQSDVQEG
jgi:hypothetical protein